MPRKPTYAQVMVMFNLYVQRIFISLLARAMSTYISFRHFPTRFGTSINNNDSTNTIKDHLSFYWEKKYEKQPMKKLWTLHPPSPPPPHKKKNKNKYLLLITSSAAFSIQPREDTFELMWSSEALSSIEWIDTGSHIHRFDSDKIIINSKFFFFK